MIVRATLVATRTADGLVEFNDDVEVGRAYYVNPLTRRTIRLRHETGVVHQKEVVNDAMSGAWLPVECLSFTEGKS